VAGYFPSISHVRLKDLLARRFKGADFLSLPGRIIDLGGEPASAPESKIGLPIGSLTSQHFANAYLDVADRWLLGNPAVRAHVRYMDDILWCCDNRQDAADTVAGLAELLHGARGLTLKPGFHIGPCAAGVRYCGFRVRPGVVLPSPRKLSRYRRHTQAIAAAEQGEGVADTDIQRASDAAHAALAYTQSLRFRQQLWARRAEIIIPLDPPFLKGEV